MRNRYMTIAKGIGIILVVVGHSSTSIKILNFIYLFHMPLFFFISGYFFKDKYTLSPWEYIKKRILGLYVPFISFELFALFFHNLFLQWRIYNEGETAQYTLRDFIAIAQHVISFNHTQIMTFTFWFLPCLFMVSLMFLGINIISAKAGRFAELSKVLMVSSVSFLGFLLIKFNVVLNWSFRTAMVALTLFYLGYLYSRYEKKVVDHFAIGAVCTVILLIGMRSRIDMSMDVYINPAFFYLNAIAGIYLTLYVSKLLCYKYSGLRFLTYCGEQTIIIMAFQYLGLQLGRMIVRAIENNVYSKMQTSVLPFVVSNIWVIVAILGLFVPIVLQYCISWRALPFRRKNVQVAQ